MVSDDESYKRTGGDQQGQHDGDFSLRTSEGKTGDESSFHDISSSDVAKAGQTEKRWFTPSGFGPIIPALPENEEGVPIARLERMSNGA